MLYALGDIHGQRAMLDRAFALIEADGGVDAPHVFLGDYTDRGPDSRGVIDALIAGRDAGRDWTFVKGNHDRMFWRFVTDGVIHDVQIGSGKSWLNPSLGGDTTLASYGIGTGEAPRFAFRRGTPERLTAFPTTQGDLDLAALTDLARAQVPQAHLDFLSDAVLMHTAEDHLFVHAGLRPGQPLDAQIEDDLIWIRDGWLDSHDDHGITVVHGHTALKKPTHFGNRVDLDAGAGYGNPLIPAVLEDGCWFTLTDAGRVPLSST